MFTRDDNSVMSGSRSTMSKVRPSDMSLNQEEIPEAIEGEDKELIEEEDKEMELPKVLQDSNFLPKVVDEETPLVIDFNQTQAHLEEAFKQIDLELNMQIFNAPNTDPRMTLDIKLMKQLGGGGGSSADVYQCKIKGLTGKYVDK